MTIKTHTTRHGATGYPGGYMANSQSTEQQIIGQRLESAGNERDKLEVRLSRELVSLLSEQLYSSPLKAIEDLARLAGKRASRGARARHNPWRALYRPGAGRGRDQEVERPLRTARSH